MFGFEHFQCSLVKKLAMKTTNVIIISGIGIGIGSAILLSMLKYIFGKSQKLELSQNHENEVTPENTNETPMVLFITSKKSQNEQPTQSSMASSSFISSSLSSSSLAFSSLASHSSTNQAAVDAQVSEIEIHPLPQLMLLDSECLRDKFKEDYMVLVMPRKSKDSEQVKNWYDDCRDDITKCKVSKALFLEDEFTVSSSLAVKRNSFDISETMKEMFNKPLSLHRCSFPRVPAIEEWRDVLCSNKSETREDDVKEKFHQEAEFEADEPEIAAPFFSSLLAGLDSLNSSDCSFLFSSSDMRSIFEDDRAMNESLLNCGSDVMEKLADIEEKLCLVHVDTEDMMKHVSTFKGPEGRRPAPFDASTPSVATGGTSTDREIWKSETHLDFNYAVEDLKEAEGSSRILEEWSFEDQLGDPNDFSF